MRPPLQARPSMLPFLWMFAAKVAAFAFGFVCGSLESD